MLKHKFFSCYYYCVNNRDIIYHKTLRVQMDQIPVDLRSEEIHDVDLCDKFDIILKNEDITVEKHKLVKKLKKYLTQQKSTDVKIFKCIILSYCLDYPN